MLKTLLFITFILSTTLSAADSVKIILHADFNADNNKDIFLAKNNEFNMLLMDGVNSQQQGSPAFILEPELSLKAAFALNASTQAKADKALQKALSFWEAKFITDLNNDNNDDIIFVHNKTQQVSTQLMDGLSILDTNKPDFNLEPILDQAIAEATDDKTKLKLEKALTKALSYWVLTHVADFNGDGNSDLLFTHKKSFRNRIQLMDGDQVIVDGVGFDSPAEAAGLDFDQIIQEVSVPRSSLPKQLMFIPALLLMGLIWKLQSGRREEKNKVADQGEATHV